MRPIVEPAALVLALLLATPAAAQEDRWQPLRFLLGTWEGTTTGEPGSGTVRREYRLILRDRFLEVRSTSTYAAQESNPEGEVHEEFGYFSYDRRRATWVFRQFHVESFVITYAAPAAEVAAGTLVFTSEAIENVPPGWSARETLRMLGPDEIAEVFELAAPGAEFAPYSETTLRRVPADSQTP